MADAAFIRLHGHDFQGRTTYDFKHYLTLMKKHRENTIRDAPERWTVDDQRMYEYMEAMHKVNKQTAASTGFPTFRAIPQTHIGLPGASLVQESLEEGFEWEVDFVTGSRRKVRISEPDSSGASGSAAAGASSSAVSVEAETVVAPVETLGAIGPPAVAEASADAATVVSIPIPDHATTSVTGVVQQEETAADHLDLALVRTITNRTVQEEDEDDLLDLESTSTPRAQSSSPIGE